MDTDLTRYNFTVMQSRLMSDARGLGDGGGSGGCGGTVVVLLLAG